MKIKKVYILVLLDTKDAIIQGVYSGCFVDKGDAEEERDRYLEKNPESKVEIRKLELLR